MAKKKEGIGDTILKILGIIGIILAVIGISLLLYQILRGM
tara:strand:- start:29 stop:148 length:120 start_codon:yes stop_codon:yes gene_type:complete